jgi:uncharacterized membrane protein YhaH (DUF805 family)
MTFWQKMFSFEGRIGRQDFWICHLILFGISIVLGIALFSAAIGPILALGMASEKNGGDVDDAAALAAMAPLFPMMGIFFLAQLAMLWPSLAIDVKRLHDRDQSGWLVLIFVFAKFVSWIPIIGLIPGLGSFLFWLINLGILEGTMGPNRYGPSPNPAYGTEQVFV